MDAASPVPLHSVRNRILRASEIEALVGGLAAIAVVTGVCSVLSVTHPTTVALSFLLVVLVVATASTRRVATATSFMAFACFNYFFLPPLGTFVIADSENWVALFALLVVSTVASHSAGPPFTTEGAASDTMTAPGISRSS